MSKDIARKTSAHRTAVILSLALVFTLIPFGALAKPSDTKPNCNAFVSTGNIFYLVTPAGKVITQFAPNVGSVTNAVIAPDGRKMAYLAASSGTNAYAFHVMNTQGQQGTFSTVPMRRGTKEDDTQNSPIEGLSWNSNNVLRVTKFVGKNMERFEFYRIPRSLNWRAPMAARPAIADNCILKHHGDWVACINGDAVYVGSGIRNQQAAFQVTGFKGIKPEESFPLGIGDSITTQGTTPSYTVTLENINKNGIYLSVTPPSGNEAVVKSGNFTVNFPVQGYPTYGFFATIVNHKSNLVRIDVVKNDSPGDIFDPALAWLPHGEGLILIRRKGSTASLYLIQPGRDRVTWHPAFGHGPQWHLVAQTSVSLPETIDSMRFATPSMLLLKTGSALNGYQFSELPITITNGYHHWNHKQPSLTVGSMTSLPTMMSVTMNGGALKANVLGWSCHGRHRHRR